MASPSTFSNIYADQINKVSRWYDQTETPLHNYRIGRDSAFKVLYVTAEVHKNSLGQEIDLTPETMRWAKVVGTAPDDEACQIIPKTLGGNEIFASNVFPCNSKMDRSQWKQAETEVYEFVAEQNDRHVLLTYAVEYKEPSDGEGSPLESCRPCKIHYHFKFHQGGVFTGQIVQGVFVNLSPRVTNQEYYCDPRRMESFDSDSE